MATYHLRNWSVVNDPWVAPECGSNKLAGTRFAVGENEGREVITGPIVSVNGRNITTHSGSVYILEDIDPNYLRWMNENNIEYRENEPVRIVSKS